MEKEKRSDLSAPQRYFLGTSTWETERERKEKRETVCKMFQNQINPWSLFWISIA
jgi:hypothetical protein